MQPLGPTASLRDNAEEVDNLSDSSDSDDEPDAGAQQNALQAARRKSSGASKVSYASIGGVSAQQARSQWPLVSRVVKKYIQTTSVFVPRHSEAVSSTASESTPSYAAASNSGSSSGGTSVCGCEGKMDQLMQMMSDLSRQQHEIMVALAELRSDAAAIDPPVRRQSAIQFTFANTVAAAASGPSVPTGADVPRGPRKASILKHSTQPKQASSDVEIVQTHPFERLPTEEA